MAKRGTRRRMRRDAGLITAEYAMATVAACGFGAVLYKLLTSDSVLRLVTRLIARALTLSFG